MGLILRDGIWMKEIAVSNVDVASLLLVLSRKKLKDGSNLWNNLVRVILQSGRLANSIRYKKILMSANSFILFSPYLVNSIL
jgi:hypothetical protein